MDAIINNKARYVLVLAGPGTGKTYILTHRIANLIHNGIGSDSILGLTFTRKASEEMQKRVFSLINQNIEIHTFHSFAYKILTDGENKGMNITRLGFLPNFKVATEEQIIGILSEILPEEQVVRIYEQIYKLKENNKNSNKYLKYLNRRLKELNLIDYPDMLIFSLTIFNKFSDILKVYQNQYTHILIDEFQDTNSLQYQLIKTISGDNTNIFAVADDDQSIYSFRGATPENIKKFIAEYNPCIYKLETNYRSVKNIIKLANNFFLEKPTDLRKTLISISNKDGEKIKYLLFSTEEKEAEFICNEILTLKNSYNLSEIAILYRLNWLPYKIIQKLQDLNIPYRIYNPKLTQLGQLEKVIELLSFVLYKTDDLFAKLLPYLSIHHSLTYESICNIFNIDTLKSLYSELEASFAPFKKRIEIFYKLKNATELRNMLSEAEYNRLKVFYQMVENFRYNCIYDIINLVFPDIIHTSEVKFLLDFAKNYNNLSDFLYNLNETISDSQFFLDDKKDKVNLLTIHSAKGLEFKVVFIIGFENGILPSSRNSIQEEKRVFYVGLTRAKERLYISSVALRKNLFLTKSKFSKYLKNKQIIEKIKFGKAMLLRRNLKTLLLLLTIVIIVCFILWLKL